MIAALAVSTVLVTSTAVVVGTNYVTTQQSAQAALFDTLASGNEKVTAVTQRAADLELAITNAQNILKDSSGKVSASDSKGNAVNVAPEPKQEAPKKSNP